MFTDWAWSGGSNAMEFGCSHQIWISIASIDRTSKERSQSGALIK
jgi:hypothetical protein